MSNVSILILTLNEEANLAECIDFCAWSDDIVVFDSMSQDRTLEIAKSKGVKVLQRRFDNYAAQRNAALTTVEYKHPWVLMVDADERVPPKLAAEIESAVAVPAPISRCTAFAEKISFSVMAPPQQRLPSWFGRLVRLGRVRVEREVNEEYIADGRVEHLSEHLHHYPFNKGIAYWFERHNRYSTMEAIAKLRQSNGRIELRAIFSGDPIDRRRALKQLLYRMPLRPLIVFFYLYIIRLGILDGRAGFHFSRMRAAYEMLIDLKVIETRRRQRDLAV
jgi:glycosyltransferase involved in cell wall biosynthesis